MYTSNHCAVHLMQYCMLTLVKKLKKYIEAIKKKRKQEKEMMTQARLMTGQLTDMVQG